MCGWWMDAWRMEEPCKESCGRQDETSHDGRAGSASTEGKAQRHPSDASSVVLPSLASVRDVWVACCVTLELEQAPIVLRLLV